VYSFPNSIDYTHFAQARRSPRDPEPQAAIARPRLGYYGVIDERLDLNLIEALAQSRPHWQLVLVGPVRNIHPARLPQAPNLHYLGEQKYQDLPAYLGNWDVAILPFAVNEAARHFTPRQTPECLAAGKPVVGTPISGIARPYADKGLIHTAATAGEFTAAVEKSMLQRHDSRWKTEVDMYLSGLSWREIWEQMSHLICQELV
jgi:glycosyltransferase involved in cell wall biosynthesis